MTAAQQIVAVLLEAEEPFNAREYFMGQEQWHEIACVATQEIRKLLRGLEIGGVRFKFSYARRLKNGDLTFSLQSVPPTLLIHAHTAEVERMVYRYLHDRFNVRDRGLPSPFDVHCWVWNTRLELDIRRGGTL